MCRLSCLPRGLRAAANFMVMDIIFAPTINYFARSHPAHTTAAEHYKHCRVRRQHRPYPLCSV